MEVDQVSAAANVVATASGNKLEPSITPIAPAEITSAVGPLHFEEFYDVQWPGGSRWGFLNKEASPPATPKHTGFQEPIRICIAGITGELGTLIAKYLLEHKHVTVHGICRQTSILQDVIISHPRLVIFRGPAEDENVARQAAMHCSAMICAYNDVKNNQWMYDIQQLLTKVCDIEKVPRYFAADYVPDFTTLKSHEIPFKDPQLAFYLSLLLENKRNTKKVKGVHILTGVFVEAFFRGFFDPNKPKIWGTGDEKWNLVTYRTIAQFVAYAAIDPRGPYGVLKFHDVACTIKEMVKEIDTRKKGGVPTPIFKAGTMEQLKEVVDNARASGNLFPHVISFLTYWVQTKGQLGDHLHNDLYPAVKTLTLGDIVEIYLRA